MSTDQAAELLGITRKSLYETPYKHSDFPEPMRVGRTLLLTPDALHTWREQHPPDLATEVIRDRLASA